MTPCASVSIRRLAVPASAAFELLQVAVRGLQQAPVARQRGAQRAAVDRVQRGASCGWRGPSVRLRLQDRITASLTRPAGCCCSSKKRWRASAARCSGVWKKGCGGRSWVDRFRWVARMVVGAKSRVRSGGVGECSTAEHFSHRENPDVIRGAQIPTMKQDRQQPEAQPQPTGDIHATDHPMGGRGRACAARHQPARPVPGRPQARQRHARRRAHLRHGLQQPALQPAQADQHEQRGQAAPGLGLQPEQPAGPGVAAHRAQRRDVRDHAQQHRCARPGHRQADLEAGDRAAPGRVQDGLLRHPQPRCRHLRRQAVPQHAGRPRDGDGRQDRQAAVEEQGRRLPERPGHDERAADRQRCGADRHRRRRVRHARLHRWLGPGHRQAALALLHHRRARPEGRRHLAW